MVEDYQKALEHIFAYSYGYCVFKHGIHGDRPRILDGMPDSANPLSLEFFENLGCPPAPIAVKAKATNVRPQKYPRLFVIILLYISGMN